MKNKGDQNLINTADRFNDPTGNWIEFTSVERVQQGIDPVEQENLKKFKEILASMRLGDFKDEHYYWLKSHCNTFEKSTREFI